MAESKVMTSSGHSDQSRKTGVLQLNVGGVRHEVLKRTLLRFPNTRLGKLAKCTQDGELADLCDEYRPNTRECYFDRQTRIFECILEMYRTKKLHILDDFCVLSFAEELRFWGFEMDSLESCCMAKYQHKLEQMEDDAHHDRNPFADEVEDFSDRCFPKQRKIIWDLMEKPETSWPARGVALFSVLVIILSTVCLTVGTLPEVMVNVTIPLNSTFALHNDTNLTDISTNIITTIVNTTSNKHQLEHFHELQDNPILEIIEIFCVIWFSLEYAVRFICSPNKWIFFKAPLNIIDLIAILPFYFSRIILAFSVSNFESFDTLRKLMQIFRVLRVLRVLKLARHSVGLQSLGYTLTQSYKELGLLMMFVMLGVLLTSSLAYYAERDANTEGFSSIPATFWWSIVTMTTVGYGDVTPRTILGRVVGTVCSLCGVLVIALPIPIIVNNFAEYYQEQVRRDKVNKRKEAKEKALLKGHAKSDENWVEENSSNGNDEDDEQKLSVTLALEGDDQNQSPAEPPSEKMPLLALQPTLSTSLNAVPKFHTSSSAISTADSFATCVSQPNTVSLPGESLLSLGQQSSLDDASDFQDAMQSINSLSIPPNGDLTDEYTRTQAPQRPLSLHIPSNSRVDAGNKRPLVKFSNDRPVAYQYQTESSP